MRHEYLYCPNCGEQIMYVEIDDKEEIVIKCGSCKSRFEGMRLIRIDKERQRLEEGITASIGEIDDDKQ